MAKRSLHPVSRIVGHNVRTRREEIGMTRETFAVDLFFSAMVDESWTETKVMELEQSRRGRERHITVDDLVSVAYVLDVEPWTLLVPYDDRPLGGVPVDVYTYRVFGMKPAEVRRKKQEQEVLVWPKTEIPLDTVLRFLERHPDVLRLRETWWSRAMPNGSPPTAEALEDAVRTQVRSLYTDLQTDETWELPVEDLANLDPHRDFTAFAEIADRFWESNTDRQDK